MNCGRQIQGFVCEKPARGSLSPKPTDIILPLSFTNGMHQVACPLGYLTFGVWTEESHTKIPCVFPFIYKKKLYYECITMENRNPWCSLTFDYDLHGSWAYCSDIKCFKLVEARSIMIDARKDCQADGASLASIHNSLEQSKMTFCLI